MSQQKLRRGRREARDAVKINDSPKLGLAKTSGIPCTTVRHRGMETGISETHSTPEVRLASFLLFLIFGTAERTPFAEKSYVPKNPSGIILHLLRVDFCNFLEVQNYSRNPAVF